MDRRYSIADARKELPELIDQAMAGDTVEITRRGEPVAVVLSLAEYERLRGGPTFQAALAQWAAEWTEDDRDLGESFFDDLRDRSPGRDVDL